MAQRDLTPAIKLIKRFEGILDGDPTTVNLDPYLCPAGYWTIGWGHVVRDTKGKMLKGAGAEAKAKAIYPHGITLEEAHSLLVHDVTYVVRDLAWVLPLRADALMNNNQFCALVSFVFNIGIGAFEKSTLLKRLRDGDFADVHRQLMRWTRGGGKVLAGLKRRREAEAKLWNTPEDGA